jgi:hypothetical protein
MRFPSIQVLAERARAVLRRFPWTIGVGAAAAAFAVAAVNEGADDTLARAALVAALGLPATVALTLVAETRRWSAGLRALVHAGALAALVLFYFSWPGPEVKHDALRYAQLSAVLHLAVAFLPFLGSPETPAFWQFNRRVFLGFLRAGVFSGVLFVGIAIALGALDKLFGVDVDGETYVRIWFVVALLVNTWIFLASVPEDLPALADDRDYPKALKVFAQYILTPLAFTYLLILLAYLVKIVAGAEWPSGWIGWLVTSVAVTGLLGFLLVYPLRADPEEGWIRTYARWLFVGLIPAAVMLLVAFVKRVVPYGLTEPRVLGIVLGLWLLGIALAYTLRPRTGIRLIPVTLAAVMLLTLYGPFGLTGVSLRSQRNRLAANLADRAGGREAAREASGALRFLVEHRATREIAQATGREPAVDWKLMQRWQADSVAREIMVGLGATYVPEYQPWEQDGGFFLAAESPAARNVAGFAWLVPLNMHDTIVRVPGLDSLRTSFDSSTGTVRVRMGRDTFAFDLRPLAAGVLTDTTGYRSAVPAERLSVDAARGARARLVLDRLNGVRTGDSARVTGWGGSLLVGEP